MSAINRPILQEIEIKESQRKIKGNTLSPREEERIIKVRITSRKEEEKRENAKRRNQREPKSGDRNRTSSGNNPCTQ